MTDEALLVSYRDAHDQEAFAELVNRHEKKLAAFLRNRHSAKDAEDAVQQAFLQVHLKCSTYDPSRRFVGWLYTIAINRAIDLKRARTRRQACLDVSVLASTLVCHQPGPEMIAERNEEALMVRSMLPHLTSKAREAIELVDLKGVASREAARLLGITAGAMKTRRHDGINRLRQLVDGEPTTGKA